MSSNVDLDNVVLFVLSQTNLPLDPESIAVTYDLPIAEARAAFERLEAAGDVEQVETGLYRLTESGERKLLTRGAARSTNPV